MDDRQHRHAAGRDLVQHPEQLELMADVEVGGGLVEEQDPRLLGEAAGQRGELPLAGESVASAAAGQRRDARALQRARDRRAVLRRERAEGPAVGIAAERHAVLAPSAWRGASSSA